MERRLSDQWRSLSESAKKPYMKEAEMKMKANENEVALKGSEKFNGVDRVTKVKTISYQGVTNYEENEMDFTSDPDYEPSKEGEGDDGNDHIISDGEDNEVNGNKNTTMWTSARVAGINRAKYCVVCKSTSTDKDVK